MIPSGGVRIVLALISTFLVTSASFTQGAEKVRVYPMGEADGGAAVGLEVDSTEDVLEPPTMDADGGDVFDQEGDFVPLDVTMGAPQYALGRGGEGSLAIDFTGGDLLSSGAFDPRNFNTFSALSQGWVKPDPAGQDVDQSLWSLGNDNGGVGITADGFWLLRAVSAVPDTVSDAEVAFDEWTHVAVFRGGNGASLFVNGELVATGDNFWNGVGPVSVGAGADGENPYVGLIDDFNIAGFSDFVFDEVSDIDFFDPDNFSGVLGDVDQNAIVDLDDYLIWSENVGFDNEQGAGDVVSLLRGDVDGNGRINYFDFEVIREQAEIGGNALILVPEPAGGVLFATGIGLVVLRLRRRRR